MNAYQVLNLNPNSTLLEICHQYQNCCQLNPSNIFIFTKAFSLLVNPFKRLNHDASIFKINIFLLFQSNHHNFSISEEEEYILANFIAWLTDFRDYCYDSKYYNSNTDFLNQLESWYDQIEIIMNDLKEQIHSFYLT